MVTEK